MERAIKDRLQTDLTRYAPGLVAGTEGVTVGRYGMWSRGSDRFITVAFPGIATLDVLWDSLEIIDEEVLREQEEAKRNFQESLKTAGEAVLHLGPRGGFRGLSFSYTDQETGIRCHQTIGFRAEAEEIKKQLEAYGIPIETKIEK